MTTEELQAKRAKYVAMIDRLEEQLADPFSSRSISAGGGSKSASSPGDDIEKRIKYFRRKVQEIDAALGTAPAPGAPEAPAREPEAPGGVTVYDVDDETAAVLMAIVSDRSGIPLERLKFKSIRPVETKE